MTKGQEKAIMELRKLRNVNKRNSLGKSIETVLNLYENNQKIIGELQKENEEKDKQIDLMAGEIEYAGCIKKVWKCDQKNCKDCIKQYFKKLAKEKGE